MALSADQLAYLRSEIGTATPPTDDDLAVSYTRLGSLEAVALEVVRGRLATLVADPASFSVEGYSQSTGANMDFLSKQAARLEGAVGMGVERLVRPVPSR